MEQRKRMMLDVSNCIVIGDSRRLEENLKPIKTIRKLVHKIHEKDKGENLPTVHATLYSKLYRYENKGAYSIDETMITLICEILKVERDELVKEFRSRRS